jgi:hypothetical protein
MVVLDENYIYLSILIFQHTQMKTTRLALLRNVFLIVLIRDSSSYLFEVTRQLLISVVRKSRKRKQRHVPGAFGSDTHIREYFVSYKAIMCEGLHSAILYLEDK